VGVAVTVLLPNDVLGIRRRVEGETNSHGERMAAGWGPFLGPYDGRTNERADGTWALGVDPALWPVRVGDLVISARGGSWLVQAADLIQNNYDSMVDWVRVTGAHRTVGGTEPGGAWFVARYTDYIEPPPPYVGPPVYQSGLWTGHGTPPEPSADFAPAEGDEYVDLDTGFIYTLGGAG
jgi:hypothetical protein